MNSCMHIVTTLIPLQYLPKVLLTSGKKSLDFAKRGLVCAHGNRFNSITIFITKVYEEEERKLLVWLPSDPRDLAGA